MNISVESGGLSLTPSADAWVRDHVARILESFEDEIVSVQIRLAEASGPGGGQGNTATIEVCLRRTPPVSVATVHRDAYTALSISAHRVERHIDCLQARRRRWQQAGLRRRREAQTAGSAL